MNKSINTENEQMVLTQYIDRQYKNEDMLYNIKSDALLSITYNEHNVR